jgi:cation transporter-like permease
MFHLPKAFTMVTALAVGLPIAQAAERIQVNPDQNVHSQE